MDASKTIERLKTQLNEAREQHAAASEVLKVISASLGEVEPAFQAMLANAMRICDAKFGILYEFKKGQFRAISYTGVPPAYAEFVKKWQTWGPKTGLGQVVLTRQVVHTRDVVAGSAYAEGDPGRVATVDLGGVRTALVVPVLKGNELIGAFVIFRQEVRSFTRRQIDLVSGFAAQAVVAIENARLFDELQARTRELTEKSAALAALSSKLAKYLAPQVYNSIFTGQQDVKIVSTRKKLTVCFSDLVGFTEITEKMELEDLTQLLNHYLTEMSKIALQYGATVDKYVGDAIVIFFGDPTNFWASSKMRWLACRWRWPCNGASANWPRNGAAAASTRRCAAGSASTPVIARSAISAAKIAWITPW